MTLIVRNTGKVTQWVTLLGIGGVRRLGGDFAYFLGSTQSLESSFSLGLMMKTRCDRLVVKATLMSYFSEC